MAESLRITILGSRGSGLTSYLLGVYAAMQLGIHGFTLYTEDVDEDLRLTHMFERLIDGGGDRWPPPIADSFDTYNFVLSYGLSPLLKLEVKTTYLPVMVSESESSLRTSNLKETLQKSDCIFFFISGEFFTESHNNSELSSIAIKANVHKMLFFLDELRKVRSLDNQPLSIAIIITKYDLCSHRSKQEIIKDVEKIFQPLFAPHSGWLVMICPVSLGKELAENAATGEIDPRNLHIPIAFAIYSRFREFFLEEVKQPNKIHVSLRSLNNGNSGNWFNRWWNSGDIEATSSNLQSSELRIAQIQKNMSLLVQELNNFSIYFSGQEVILADMN